MKIGDRLKILRKEYLEGISQDKFADRIGTTGAAISRYESADRAIPNSIILSICREFNVNRAWLETGEGEPFVETASQTLDKIAKRYHGSDTFRAILDAYVQLDADEQSTFEHYIALLSETIAAGEKPESAKPPVDSFSEQLNAQYGSAPGIPAVHPDRAQGE